MSFQDVDDAAERISGEARGRAAMLYLFNDQEAIDLFRIIEHRRSQPSARERRYQRLGLILRLIAATGEQPDSPTYDGAHERATQRGDSWPDRGTLETHYGSFEKACEAAIRFLREGSASRVPSSYHHATRRPPNGTYLPDPDEQDRLRKMHVIADALIAFRDREHCWPEDIWEYLEWAEHRRRDARFTGQPAPLLPGRKEILRLFPDFEEAVAFAKVRAGEIEP